MKGVTRSWAALVLSAVAAQSARASVAALLAGLLVLAGGVGVAEAGGEGNLVWAKRAGGTSIDIGLGVAALSDGSALVTGYFNGTATFGPGETNETSLTSCGGDDLFLAKYNPDGTLAWAKRAGGTSSDCGYGIGALSDGSALVTGYFNGTATFGPGEPNQTSLTCPSGGGSDIFLARYSANGTLTWAKRAGGTGYDVGDAIASLADGSALVAGHFYGTATFGPGEANETSLTSAGTLDIFLAKYNPDGTLAWAKRAGGTSSDIGLRVAALSDGSALVTGYFYETATFGPGEPNQMSLASAGGADMFAAKYNPNGTLAWAKRAGGTSSDCGYDIGALSDGSALVTGYFRGSAAFGPGEANETWLDSASSGYFDIFLAKYNPNGTLAWAKRAGGTMEDVGRGVAALSDGSALVTGYFYGTATFGPGDPNETSLTAGGNYEIFVAKYNPDGALAWAKRAGGSSSDNGYGIAALSDGSALATGHFQGTATFGPGEANETSLTTAGGSDIFVAKFGPGVPTRVLSVQSSPITGIQIAGSPAGTTNYSAELDDGTEVSLTAPTPVDSGGVSYDFLRWQRNGADQPAGQATLTFAITEDTAALAVYQQTNRPPVANAGPDQTVEQTSAEGAQVPLDGSGSSDPDLDPLTYGWTWAGGSASGVNPSVTLPLGQTTITLVVNDGKVDSAPDTVVVTVQDTTPPEIVAAAGVPVEQVSAAGTPVQLASPTVSDICDANLVVTNDAPAVFPLGTTVVTWTAADASGNKATATQQVTVVDTTAPVIESLHANPSTLWPVNHKMVAVTVEAHASDICDAAPTCRIVSVTSNEPINGPGDGNTQPDWQITGDHTVQLRAERSGNACGRIYTLTVEVLDASGNKDTGTVTVTVPHDQKKGK